MADEPLIWRAYAYAISPSPQTQPLTARQLVLDNSSGSMRAERVHSIGPRLSAFLVNMHVREEPAFDFRRKIGSLNNQDRRANMISGDGYWYRQTREYFYSNWS